MSNQAIHTEDIRRGAKFAYVHGSNDVLVLGTQTASDGDVYVIFEDKNCEVQSSGLANFKYYYRNIVKHSMSRGDTFRVNTDKGKYIMFVYLTDDKVLRFGRGDSSVYSMTVDKHTLRDVVNALSGGDYRKIQVTNDINSLSITIEDC